MVAYSRFSHRKNGTAPGGGGNHPSVARSDKSVDTDPALRVPKGSGQWSCRSRQWYRSSCVSFLILLMYRGNNIAIRGASQWRVFV